VTAAAVGVHDFPGDQDLVLAGRQLRAGVTLEDTSRFADDSWRLDPAILQHHIRSLSLVFDTVPARYRLHAKQLCFALLSGPLPPGEKRYAAITVRAVFGEAQKFLNWLETRPGRPGRPAGPALGDLTGQDLLDYQHHMVAVAGRGDGALQNARGAVGLFWRYRRELTDPLRIDPRQIEGRSARTARARENTTGRIPEPVLAPLITWALRFVDEFAPDILSGQKRWHEFRARFTNGQLGRNAGLTEDLAHYLDDHIRHGRPLPGRRGTRATGQDRTRQPVGQDPRRRRRQALGVRHASGRQQDQDRRPDRIQHQRSPGRQATP